MRLTRSCLCVAACFLLAAAGCGRKVGAEGLDATVDAGPVDAEAAQDAGTVDLPDDCVQYDFCGDGFFQLPLDRTDHVTYPGDSHGHLVAYKKAFESGVYTDLYVFDLRTCTECRLTDGQAIVGESLHGSRLAYATITEDQSHVRIHLIDLEQWTVSLLIDTVTTKSSLALHGDHLVYSEFPGTFGDPQSPFDLVLYDMGSGHSNVLAGGGCFTQAPDFDNDGSHVVWWARDDDLAANDDVFVFAHDLASSETRKLEPALRFFPPMLHVSGRWITWLTRPENSEPYADPHLLLFDLVADDTSILVEQDRGAPYGRTDRDLLVYRTSQYTTDASPWPPVDMELLDIPSGATARLTTRPVHHFGVTGFSYPWVTFGRSGPQQHGDLELYVAHLERLGVVDTNGEVIPNAIGVFDPPPE